MRRSLRWLSSGGDLGSAVVEFVFVAVVVMMPLVYFVVAAAAVQRSQLAVTQAAREGGRAFVTSSSGSDARQRVAAAVRLTVNSHGLPDDVVVQFVASGASCGSAAVQPRLAPSAEFTICVTRRVELPAVPTVLTGRGVSCVGRYTVHVDDYRAANDDS